MSTSTRSRLRRLLLLTTALAFGSLLPAASPAPRFAHETSDLKPDPAAKFGVLENGVRYVVHPNREPKGRVSMRLLVLAGSLHEEENQRGVAHFLEHMAFNGSKHFPPGTLVEFFQRIGMSFGGDTNASTGFDRTLYVLELPDAKTETLEEGLRVLADDANGLLLKSEEIDKERGIIMSEKRVRDSIAFRTQIAQFNFMLGDTRLPARIPIGLAEVIEKAPRERFVEFWDTWYRPENIAVVVVGEVDVSAMEKLIAAAFSTVTARGPAKPVPSRGAVTKFEGVRAGFHREAEAPATSVGLACMTSITAEPDTAANRLKRLPRQLAVAMLNRRLSVLAKKENAPFSAARASVSENFDIFREASVDLACKPEQWTAALALGEQELRRALEHGFQPAELKEAAANLANSLDQAVKTAASRRSGALSDQIANTILNDNVFTHPSTSQALFRPALDKVTPADCTAALRAAFAGNGRYVMVTGNATIPGDAVAAITAAYDAARAVAVQAPPKEEASAWAYTNFGAPGKVAKREQVADLDVTLVTFANGVRLNLKKTDFEVGRVRLSARVGNGAMTEPRDQRGLASLAGGTFNAGGLGKLSVDDLRRVLAGRNAPVGFGLAADAFTFSSGQGSTNRDDLLLTLQLLTAHLTDPGYRPEALRQAQKGLEQMYLGFAHTPNGPMSMEVANLIAGGDSRFGVPPKELMLARNFDEVRAWLTPQFAKGAIEVAVVGDLDADATIAAVAQTLGALPPREPKPALADLRKVSFPAQPFTKSYAISSELPKGLVTLYWPTTDASDVKRTRRLSLLASVYSDRLRVKIREEMAGTYSPRAGSSPSDTFTGYGYITTSIDVDPPMADKVAEAAIALADDLAKNGVTAEELNRARQPMLTATRESLRSNAYWLGNVLARAQEKPEMLDWSRTRLSDIEAITEAELTALAKSYLGRERVSRVTVLPEKK